MITIFSKPGLSQGLLYKNLRDSLMNWLIQTWFVKISLRRRHAQSFTNGASNHETNYKDIFSEILNPEGHQNCCIG